VLARSIGFIGHALDQKRLQQPLYRHPWEDVLCEWLGGLQCVGMAARGFESGSRGVMRGVVSAVGCYQGCCSAGGCYQGCWEGVLYASVRGCGTCQRCRAVSGLLRGRRCAGVRSIKVCAGT
jgi:hypothetical protein